MIAGACATQIKLNRSPISPMTWGTEKDVLKFSFGLAAVLLSFAINAASNRFWNEMTLRR